jgi:hypothetical protein
MHCMINIQIPTVYSDDIAVVLSVLRRVGETAKSDYQLTLHSAVHRTIYITTLLLDGELLTESSMYIIQSNTNTFLL